MEYYLKKLKRNELGVNGEGKIARGRFIYITKTYDLFFPFLSKTVRNDNVLIPVIPPFTDAKIYCNLVYHNDKYNLPFGTRDEYRLYLNKDIDPNKEYFQVDDIIVFQRIQTKNLMPNYFLYKFTRNDPNYLFLNNIIEVSPIKGYHAFVDSLDLIMNRRIDVDETEVVIPTEVIENVKIQQEEILSLDDSYNSIEETRGAKLFGPDSFRDFVLMAYDFKCAITGNSIKYKNLTNIEAAHIQPKAHLGTYLPCNGIALSRDMHWAFDKGLISISDDYRIIVHEKIKNSSLKYLDGKIINVPIDAYFRPEKKFLKHHRENIFGLFLYSGSIRSF